MKLETLHVNMRVKHPQLGVGTVKRILEHTADIQFDEGVRTIAPETSGLEPAEAHASISGLDVPLNQLIQQAVQKTVEAVAQRLGLQDPSPLVSQLGLRWHNGQVVLHPADPTLQTKEVPLETFFHKVVMMRNNLRVLEQKINGHPQLSDGEKVEMQQYITRCYGSMTTFNILFKEKEDQFG
jgi:hypothetical protein